MKEAIESILNKHTHSQRDSLIPILQEIQEEVGYISEEAIVLIGNFLKMPTSKVYGLATFYNQFRFQQRGKYHFQVCHGTACHVLGAVAVIDYLEKTLKIKSGQTSRNGRYSLEVVSCIGACAQAPVVSINEQFYPSITEKALKELLDNIINEE